MYLPTQKDEPVLNAPSI